METGSPYRPRLSRETRLLLATGVMAVAALWLLARVRFPDRPVPPNPVPLVLSQLAGGPKFDDLAAEIAQLQARLQPSLVSLLPGETGPQPTSRVTALRFRDDFAVTLIPSGSNREPWKDGSIRGFDRASGLAVVSVVNPGPTPPPAPWTPRQPRQSRYLIASDVSLVGVSLRPVFVGSLDPVESLLWSEPVWAVPAHTELAPGAFLFTNTAELAGLVIAHVGGLAIVPAGTVLAEAERLLAIPPGPAGSIGIDVQDLTGPLSAATGAPAGVVVTWVDADGAGRDLLMVGDVIEAVDGRPLATRQQWDVRLARLTVGETLSLRVRRPGEVREVAVMATPPAVPAPANRSLGLALRTRTKIGAEVVRVERGSAAERAGLAAGDIITLVAGALGPTPTQVMRSYTSLGPGERVMIAVTRGDAHFVTTLER
jgi:hypothetical protein